MKEKWLSDNKMLGNFELGGDSACCKRNVPQIEVAFDIDANGIVSVSAKDKGTGKEQKIQIQASGGFSQMKKFKRWLKMLRRIKSEDKQKREAVDARNQADSIIFIQPKKV